MYFTFKKWHHRTRLTNLIVIFIVTHLLINLTRFVWCDMNMRHVYQTILHLQLIFVYIFVIVKLKGNNYSVWVYFYGIKYTI